MALVNRLSLLSSQEGKFSTESQKFNFYSAEQGENTKTTSKTLVESVSSVPCLAMNQKSGGLTMTFSLNKKQLKLMENGASQVAECGFKHIENIYRRIMGIGEVVFSYKFTLNVNAEKDKYSLEFDGENVLCSSELYKVVNFFNPISFKRNLQRDGDDYKVVAEEIPPLENERVESLIRYNTLTNMGKVVPLGIIQLIALRAQIEKLDERLGRGKERLDRIDYSRLLDF
ncbi:hypothetical protein J4230_00825 [Candidatus Woesearchaeota archaeon]|nr:hypothetical protein [Candidatus Woesearchaeota archaeon]